MAAEAQSKKVEEKQNGRCGGRGRGRGRGGKGEEKSSIGRKRKEAFIYGNYKSYYGYRINRNMGEDPRLDVFKRDWFERKDCLDIGCNQGLITISLARKFQCRSILGIDIDSGLIETARWNLRKIARLENANNRSMENSNMSDAITEEETSPSTGEVLKSKQVASTDAKGDLSKIVSFQCENFVETLDVCSEKYDTIICLSVTKWIHLNWGDDGLITFFVKVWKLLRPGGIFLVEPQPWISYKKNRTVSEIAKVNFKAICLYPENFREILLDKIGFRTADVITNRLSGTVAGFDRPIEAYCKGNSQKGDYETAEVVKKPTHLAK